MAKVLIHSLVFSPDGVSTAYLYSDLARELRKLGHSITVLTTTPHYNVLNIALQRQPLTKKRGNWLYFSECDGIPVWHIAMPKKSEDVGARIRGLMQFHFRALQFGILDHKIYDVILSPSPPLTIGVVSWLLAKRLRAKSVYNVQEIYPDFAINQGVVTNPVIIWLLRHLERLVYSKSEIIVTIGDSFKKVVTSRGGGDLKVITIPNFVDTELYRPMPRDNAFAREHGLVGKFVIMYAGNIGLAQDWEPLLYAAQSLSNLPVKFVIIGEGTRRRWLEVEIKRRNASNVFLMEYQRRELMPEINASCDIATILMDPKVTADGFPSKIYTTMACGKPTVVCCAMNSELVSIIQQSKCGTWVRSGDMDGYVRTITSYIHDQDRLVREGSAGRIFATTSYSKETVTKMYDQLIREVAGNVSKSKLS